MIIACLTCTITIAIFFLIGIGFLYGIVICDDEYNFKEKDYRIITESTTNGILYIPQWSYFGKLWHNFSRYVCYVYDVGEERCSFASEAECMEFLKKEYDKNRMVISHKPKIINFDNTIFNKNTETTESGSVIC